MAWGLLPFIFQARGESNIDELETRAVASAAPAEAGGISLLEVLGLSGSVRAADFSKDKSFSGETDYTVGSIWATARPAQFWGISTYFDGRVQGQNLVRSSRVSWELREAYAQMALGRFDLRAGRQITVWGRADKVNPTDTWSTRDFSLLASNDEDQRLGVASLQGTWSSGAYRAVGVWQPEWRYPVLPIPPLPSGDSVRNVARADPAGQFGLKIDHSGEGMDWSVSYSDSIDRVPDLSLVSASPQRLPLGLIYQQVTTLGADAAVPIGKYGLRGEVAYTRTRDHDGTDPLTKNSNVFLVVGGERTFDGVLNINAQYLYRRTFDFAAPSSISDPNTRLLAQQADLISNQLAQDMHGASLRINYKAWNETLEIEVAGAVWFKQGDSVVRPKVTYAFSDRVKGIIGGEIYDGPGDSFFGRLNRTSAGYLELQFGF